MNSNKRNRQRGSSTSEMASVASTNDNDYVIANDQVKGRQIISRRTFQPGELIFEEQPLVLAQFEWNKLYKYSACEYCLYPLESCEQNVRRLCQDSSIVIPHLECDPNQMISQRIFRCPKCNEMYCSAACYQQALNSYHSILCQCDEGDSKVHLIRHIIDLWRSAHPPPETTSISLVLKLMAMLKQSNNRLSLLQELQKFSQGVQSDNQRFYHKLLRKEFQSQVDQLRQALENFNEQYMQIAEFKWFLTPDGFRQLLALLGRNQQGVGTSVLATWVKNCEALTATQPAAAAAGSDMSQLIDTLYTKIDDVSGEFIDCEGSGLFKLQSCLNHSCDANTEIQYRHNNFTLSVVATRSISSNEEMTINYLSECDRGRSRHSRQKLLQENYLFLCQCNRCLSEALEPDETSEEEESENEMEED